MPKKKAKATRKTNPDLWLGLIFGLLSGLLGNLFIKFLSNLVITSDPNVSLVGALISGFAFVVSFSVLVVEFVRSLKLTGEL